MARCTGQSIKKARCYLAGLVAAMNRLRQAFTRYHRQKEVILLEINLNKDIESCIEWFRLRKINDRDVKDASMMIHTTAMMLIRQILLDKLSDALYCNNDREKEIILRLLEEIKIRFDANPQKFRPPLV